MKKLRCPCCGNYTLESRGDYDICPVCFWEDDDASEEFGKAAPERMQGPNHVHLWQGRENFLSFGVAELKDKPHVRPPKPDELPEANLEK